MLDQAPYRNLTNLTNNFYRSNPAFHFALDIELIQYLKSKIEMAITNKKSLKKFILLGSLYASQFIPLVFLSEAVPVFMRQQGISLEAIGLLSLTALPVTLKFLWSPLIDRYGFTRWGHYRFWIILFQLLVVLTTAIVAFLEVKNSFTVLFICMFSIALFCSSQDIASDALAVGLLKPQERGLGNGIQSAGGYFGAIVGGGGMLILLNIWGWKITLLAMSFIMAISLIPLLFYKEQQTNSNPEVKPGSVNNYLKNLTNFSRRPQMWKWLLILAIYPIAPYMASTMFRPLLVDIGLSLTDIGLLVGGVSYTSGLLGAVLAGVLITTIGRRRSLIIFSSLEVAALLLYLLPALGFKNSSILYLVAIVTQLALGMLRTVIYTVMMDKSNIATAGTDYTIQTSIPYFSAIIAAILSGVTAKTIGYTGLFTICILIAIVNVIIIFKAFVNTEEQQQITQ